MVVGHRSLQYYQWYYVDLNIPGLKLRVHSVCDVPEQV